MLAFYDFPAEHWKHIRTTNPIESTFTTVRPRTNWSKGFLSRESAFVMVVKLIKNSEKPGDVLMEKISCQRLFPVSNFLTGWKLLVKPDGK
ncbi:MAG: transposase [Alphaproteobacteria bacterium]|nr:transposase [Alphaproteobacteria bacterium]